MSTSYAAKIAEVTLGEFDRFRDLTEDQEPLRSRIREYWSVVGPFPTAALPWGGVFTSFCVKSAGVDASEFAFSPSHSTFTYFAIQNAIAGTGVFRGRDATVHAPKAGDVLVLNGVGGSIDYKQAAVSKSYKAHSAVVVEHGSDEDGPYLLAVRGNVSDAIGRMTVRLDASGVIRPASGQRYIAVIEAMT